MPRKFDFSRFTGVRFDLKMRFYTMINHQVIVIVKLPDSILSESPADTVLLVTDALAMTLPAVAADMMAT
jgi:hypothetical protein